MGKRKLKESLTLAGALSFPARAQVCTPARPLCLPPTQLKKQGAAMAVHNFAFDTQGAGDFETTAYPLGDAAGHGLTLKCQTLGDGTRWMAATITAPDAAEAVADLAKAAADRAGRAFTGPATAAAQEECDWHTAQAIKEAEAEANGGFYPLDHAAQIIVADALARMNANVARAFSLPRKVMTAAEGEAWKANNVTAAQRIATCKAIRATIKADAAARAAEAVPEVCHPIPDPDFGGVVALAAAAACIVFGVGVGVML
jgi:hypothetical protein